MSGRAGAWLLALATAGCRAAATSPYDLTPVYDLAPPPPDLAPAADMLCPPGAEVCGDGCDNDNNGLTDADDPACTPMVLATRDVDGVVMRWIPGGAATPLVATGVGGQYAAAYRRDVLPGELWVVLDGGFLIRRFRISDGMMTWKRTDLSARDVCFFGGTTILVSQTGPAGALHLLAPDGTDADVKMVSAGAPAACASDGKLLYVAVHTGNQRSQFVVYDANYNVTAMLPMPPSLVEDRCLDLAWTSRGFYGLFAESMGNVDRALSPTRAYPFAMDGGVGAPVEFPDGDFIHALGEYAP